MVKKAPCGFLVSFCGLFPPFVILQMHSGSQFLQNIVRNTKTEHKIEKGDQIK